MKPITIKFAIIFFFILLVQISFADTFTTVKDGPWNDASTWDANGIPSTSWPHTSTADINVSHKLTISSDIDLTNCKTIISVNAELSGQYQIDLKASGAYINNYGKIDVGNLIIGYGTPTVNNYGDIFVSGTFDSSGNVNNIYQSSTVHGYIEVLNLLLKENTLTNDHHIKVNNNMTVQGTASFINNSTGVLYVVSDIIITSNTTISNEGKVYIDGTLDNSNGNITGAGGQCNSDGLTDIPTSSGGIVACSAGIGPLDSTFPIELISFYAESSTSYIELNWTTATEINNDFFTIERSMDAENWEEITFIAGAGNSNGLLNYSFTDKNPIIGKQYYKLKQTDYDGSFTYSEILVVNMGEEISSAIKLYPNPTLGQLYIEAENLDMDNIFVFDVLGKELTNKVSITQSGDNQFTLDLSNLPVGMFFIKTPSATAKFFKQ